MYENEMNEMRQQMAILKNKLDRQEIVNDRIIRRSMKRNVGNIRRRYYFVIALALLMCSRTFNDTLRILGFCEAGGLFLCLLGRHKHLHAYMCRSHLL